MCSTKASYQLSESTLESDSSKLTTKASSSRFGTQQAKSGTPLSSRFKTITATYYKGAHGCILVYDITDRQSFQDIETWLGEVRQHASPNIVKILVGNKCDLKDQRQVSYEEGKQFADSLGMQFLETSAKDKINIDEAFMTLTKAILPTVPENKREVQDGGDTIVPSRKQNKKKDGGCC